MGCFGGNPVHYCGGKCVDTSASATNCSATGDNCGVACDVGKVCADGHCADACAADQGVCSGNCTDFARDPYNCGACNVVCPPSQPNCQQGTCLGI